MIYLFHSKVRRQGSQAPVYYHITDTTDIAKVPVKRLLSHTKSKMELTIYLGQKIKEYADGSGKQVVVAWKSVCRATHKDVGHLQSNQVEADTNIILHALDATADGATELQIHSPDTDVSVLALRRYPELCKNMLFVMGRGQHHRIIELKPVVETLGPEKIAALPAFHALSGPDNTGSFQERESFSAGRYLQKRIHQLSLPLQNLDKPLRSLSVCHINQEQNL